VPGDLRRGRLAGLTEHEQIFVASADFEDRHSLWACLARCEDLRHALAAAVVRLRLIQNEELERRAGRGFLRRWLRR
jgi:hypothetical protein